MQSLNLAYIVKNHSIALLIAALKFIFPKLKPHVASGNTHKKIILFYTAAAFHAANNKSYGKAEDIIMKCPKLLAYKLRMRNKYKWKEISFIQMLIQRTN